MADTTGLTTGSRNVRRLFLGLLLLGLLGAVSCAVDVDEKLDGFPCNPDGGCELGMLCVDGKCERDACDGVECAEGLTCVAGACVDPCSGSLPLAVAGPDQVVDPESEVVLDGSGSQAEAPGDLAFAWSQVGGTAVSLSNADGPVADFTAPFVSGSLTFSLLVTDSCGEVSEADIVVVEVRQLPPVVVIEAPSVVDELESVTVNGAGSADPRGREIVGWTWQVSWNGAHLVVQGASESIAHFQAPRVSGEVEPIEVTLTLTNDLGESGSETVFIQVRDVINEPPVAVAKGPQTVSELNMVTLDGTDSFDPNGDPITYAWHQDRSDGSPEVTIQGADTATPSFQAPRVAESLELTFVLVVADGRGETAESLLTVGVGRTIVALGIDLQPPAILESGEVFSIRVEVLTSDGQREPRADDIVTLSLLDGTALLGQTVLAAVDGVAIFEGLSVDAPGAGYRISADSPLLQSANSEAFSVFTVATHLEIVTAPGPSVTAGESFSVVVEVLDDTGALANGFSGAVTLAIGSGPVGANLSGLTSVSAMGGVATFSNLWLNRVGLHTLAASAPSLTGDVTPGFFVVPAPTFLVAFATDPHTVTAGACSGPVLLEPRDEYGNLSVTASDMRIQLVSDSGSLEFHEAAGCVGGLEIGSVILVAGQSSVGLRFRDTAAGSPAIDVTPDGLGNNTRQLQTVQAAAAASLAVVTQPPSSVSAGQAFSVTVAASDAFGNAATTYGGLVSIDFHPFGNLTGASLLGTTTVTAASGVASFTGLTVDTEGDGYMLQATAAGLTSAETATFSVTNEPTRILVTIQPPNPLAVGSHFTVTAAAVNDLGIIAPSFEGSFVISIQSPPSPAGSTLLGSTTATAPGGVSTFTDLRVDQPGSGFVLRVADAAGQLLPADSISFEVQPFAGGAGTQADPYRIANVHQLREAATHLASHFVLFEDIEAAESRGWNGGEGFLPIGTVIAPFTGNFNGAGHVIFDLAIDRQTISAVGLFGAIGAAATVRQVCLINVYVRGYSQVGALVGQNDGGLIYQVCSAGDVRGMDVEIGGLIGRNAGTLLDGYSTASVSSIGRRVAGIAGCNRAGFIERVYATGQVSGAGELGGITGRPSGPQNYVRDSFWDTQTTGVAANVALEGTGKTTLQMLSVRTYTDVANTDGLSSPWDFVGDPYDDVGSADIWDIDGFSPPFLTVFAY